ncbi:MULTISPECIES: M35 family metallo-endopeptidase [unclassified Janthinobacterium]|uniref:M35 family metallo-endopeptidase n=1 Tax=unclassified Janthinobacterium TaxID=2610881 RepID=UPI0009D965FD|nr:MULTISPECIES: M35 family metallo-endopeptidase [unclassified Janthinobacterium]MEC5161343.1 hypothetical protein [Janthinobacterium sp. CG_S6]
MTKTDEQRVWETLEYLPVLFMEKIRGLAVQTILKQWTKQQNLALLSERLSLGGWHPCSSASDVNLRHTRRALLLAFEYNRLPLLKTLVSSMSMADTKQRFLKQCDLINPVIALGATTLAASFNYATESEKLWALGAGGEVRPRLNAGVAALWRVPSDRNERLRFEKWFGTFSGNRYDLVLRNFEIIRASTKGYRLYYRGDRLTNNSIERIPPHNEEMPIRKVVDSAGFYSPDEQRDSDPQNCHIFLGSPFWGPAVTWKGQEGVSTSRCAVLIHELTHCLCGTLDKLGTSKGYGSDNCKNYAARNSPDVLRNASNYQWYIDEFS